MSVHLHHTRQLAAWILGAAALSPFALCFASPTSEQTNLSPVTGRLTIAGRPAGDMTLCLDEGDLHSAYGALEHDGTFRLSNMRWIDDGAVPGRYRAHLLTHVDGVEVPSRYRDSKTSGIVIDIAAGWNDFRIDLP